MHISFLFFVKGQVGGCRGGTAGRGTAGGGTAGEELQGVGIAEGGWELAELASGQGIYVNNKQFLVLRNRLV